MSSCDCKCCRIVKISIGVVRSLMKKHGLFNACLMSSAILSSMLSKKGIPHQIVAGYLLFNRMYVIRHIWVAIHPNPMKECPPASNFTADVLDASHLAPIYQLELPKDADFIDRDESNSKEHELLEEMLDRVCVQVGKTRCVADRNTVINEIVEIQPLWKDIMSVLGL